MNSQKVDFNRFYSRNPLNLLVVEIRFLTICEAINFNIATLKTLDKMMNKKKAAQQGVARLACEFFTPDKIIAISDSPPPLLRCA